MKNKITYTLLVFAAFLCSCANGVKSEVEYKVEHVLQTVDCTDYVLADTEILKGFTGDLTEAKAANYEGFEPLNFQQSEIKDSTTVTIKYNRKQLTYSLDIDNSVQEITGVYGSKLEVEVPEKNGYVFAGWSSDGKYYDEIFFTAEDNLSFTAVYLSSESSFYTVRYFFENIEDESYTEDVTMKSIIPAFTGTQTNVIPLVIAGFQPQQIKQEVVAQDNSTVVNVYYKRKIITLFVDLNGGTGLNYIQGKYGTPIDAGNIDSVTKIGYGVERFEPELPATFDYADDGKTVSKIIWKLTVEEAFYSVRILYENIDDDGYTDQDIAYYFKGKPGEMTQIYKGEDSQMLGEARGAFRNNIYCGDTLINTDIYHYLTEDGFENQEIKADNSTVINIKIRRGRCKLTLTGDVSLKGYEKNADGNYVFEGKSFEPIPNLEDWIKSFPNRYVSKYYVTRDCGLDGTYEEDGKAYWDCTYDSNGNWEATNLCNTCMGRANTFPAYDVDEKINIFTWTTRYFDITIDPNGHAVPSKTTDQLALKYISSPKYENNKITGRICYPMSYASNIVFPYTYAYPFFHGYTTGKFTDYFTVDSDYTFIGFSEYPSGKDEKGNDAIISNKSGDYTPIYRAHTLYAQYKKD